MKSLASKMKSERDLRRKLAERAEDDAAVSTVVGKLKDLGYLSDERFAADFTRLRQENDKFGRRRVQQGLMQRGIAPTITQQTLSTAYDEIDEAQLAREYIARKRLQQPDSPDREVRQKQTAKVMRRLVAAGFSSRAVWKLLRDWSPELSEEDIQAGDDT